MRSVLITLFFLITQLYADIHAIKSGVLIHGEGPISSGREKGYDLNVELLYQETFIYAHLATGVELNNSGFTNFLYGGLAWDGYLFDFLAWEIFWGGAIHDGNLTPKQQDRRALGSRVLFREAIALGFGITENMTLTLIYAHYSHSGADEGLYNQGNDNTGLRLAYYF